MNLLPDGEIRISDDQLGRNELFWEHQGTATVRWGFGADEMRCVPRGAERRD
ncbi:MAG: hypothetical protein P8080_09905 [Gammaproteobacteria bacterium]